ncbi:MAG: hypothetical protein AAGB15_15955 [Pseudomonadota bacterium]
MIQFLSRTPFTLLGAIGLFSLVSDFVALQKDIDRWIDAWKSVTRPIWDFLLGWLFDWIGWAMPWWLKDYLTVGLIVGGMAVRLLIVSKTWNFEASTFVGLILSVFLWPFTLYHAVVDLHFDEVNDAETQNRWVFWETGIYLLILIAVNYALIFGGSPTAA